MDEHRNSDMFLDFTCCEVVDTALCIHILEFPIKILNVSPNTDADNNSKNPSSWMTLRVNFCTIQGILTTPSIHLTLIKSNEQAQQASPSPKHQYSP